MMKTSKGSPKPSSNSNMQVPIFRLPLEILTEIFLMLCEPIIENILRAGHSMIHVESTTIQPITPFFLGSICHTWRLAVWNLPVLWCSIVLHPSSDKERHSAQLQLLEEWIARSGAFPLSICLTSNEQDLKSGRVAWWEGPGYFEIYCILDSYAERWRSLEIIVPGIYPYTFPFQDHLPRISKHAPNLFSLSLRPPFGMESSGSGITVLSDAAPLLRSVTLVELNPAEVELPWPQLLSFTTVGLDWGQCMEILLDGSNLKNCLFKDICDGFDFGYESDNIRAEKDGGLLLPNMATFEMDNASSPNAIKTILQCCSCPALKELAIRLMSYQVYSSDLLAAMADFLSRSSSSSLRSLTLRGAILKFPSDDLNLIRCFEAAQSIETLELSIILDSGRLEEGLTPNFFDRFDPRKAKSSGNKVLFPNLQKLIYIGPISFALAELIDVLKCRWKCGSAYGVPVQQLKTVDIRVL